MQDRFYLNFLRQDYLFTTNHNLMYGFSHSTDRYNESSRKLLNLRFTHTLLHQQDGLFLIQLRSVDKP